MSNRATSRPTGPVTLNRQRPKSKVAKKANKARATILRAERQEKNAAVYQEALKKIA